MEAIREIKKVISNEITIKLPDDYNNKEVEIIILPYDVKSSDNKKKIILRNIYNDSKGILPENYKFNREEIHER